MNATPFSSDLRRGQSLRLVGPHRVLARQGTLWLTVDGEREDLVLDEGHSVRLTGDTPALVTALGAPARLCATPLAQASRLQRWWQRLHGDAAHGGGVAA